MILSGIRVRRTIPATSNSLTVMEATARQEASVFFSVANRTVRVYDSVVGVVTREQWETSNNSAYQIQRENLVSRPLRPSDSQARPSVREPQGCCTGTQANQRSESRLADGVKSRAVQSDPLLASGKFVRCKSRFPGRGTSGYVLNSNRTAEGEGVAPSARYAFRSREIEKSGFVCLGSSVHHQHLAVTRVGL